MINDIENIGKSSTRPGVYTIENDKGTKLVVSNLGAAVISLFLRDKDGNYSDVVLGYEKPDDYLGDEHYMGTVVGRYANRIAGDTVEINGHHYKLSTRNGAYHHHGGTVGFNKKLFLAEPFQGEGIHGIIFRYTSPHLEEGFPGELQLQVIYTLDNADRWTVEYKAISDRTTLVNFTQHTYFNLSGDPSTTIDDHELKIPSNFYLPVNEMQVPTGETEDVSDTPFDFRQLKRIGTDIDADNEQLRLSKGYDHSFVLEKTHSTLLKHVAVVKDPASGRKLEMYTTEPAVHFYSGNFLQGVPGKNNCTYNVRAGFCLETQHFPDAPNHPHFPSTILEAGETYYSKTIFIFSLV